LQPVSPILVAFSAILLTSVVLLAVDSQLRDIERIRNKKAELRRKAEVRRCQGAGERGQDANSAAVMHRHHDHRQ
jgi:hypothetical protein